MAHMGEKRKNAAFSDVSSKRERDRLKDLQVGRKVLKWIFNAWAGSDLCSCDSG